VVAPAQAAFPGTPGPIVYSKSSASETETSGGLVAHSPRRGGGTHQLTETRADSTPSVSADGRMIAFSGDNDPGTGSSSHIYVMNADGSDITALTSGENYDSNPSFSPNGRQIVFDRMASVGHPHIFIVNVDGSGLRQLTDGSTVSDYDPVFAPNGKWIALTSNRDHDVRTDRSDIFSMRPDGTHLKVLIDGPRNESEADISPDGRQIAFSSNSGGRGPNIFVATSSGRHVRALTHLRQNCSHSYCYFSPAWSPDGKHIAFLRSSRYDTSLEVMRADGTHMTEFATSGTEEEGYGSHIGPPAWGPLPR
jgi:TolB protein